MKFALLDQVRCSCGNDSLRLEHVVTVQVPLVAPLEEQRCRKFCGLKQQPVSPETTPSSDCAQCHGRVVLQGVLRCQCGQNWRIVDRMPLFATRQIVDDPRHHLRVVETDPETDPRWEPFVARHPSGSIYHHRGWLRALEEEYSQERVCLACENSDGQLMAILPMCYTRGLPFNIGGQVTGRRLSSLPRTPVAGPLSIDPEATRAVIHASVERARQESGVQLQIKTQSPDLVGSVDGVVQAPWRCSYLLELPSDPAQLKFGNSVTRHRIKWAVNKATKLGLQVRAAEDESELRLWYELYLDAMRRNTVPPRPYRFFQALWRLLHPSGLLQLLLAERANGVQRTILAGSIFLRYGPTTSYAFTGCRKKDLLLHPNDLIQWNAIHTACRSGFRWYDFGEVPEEHQQLATFKSKWGAEPSPLYRYYYPPLPSAASSERPFVKSLHQLGGAVWSRLPLGLTARLGDRIYSYL